MPAKQAGTGPKQILNTTHATIDYRIDQVGPSGVGKVEVFLTSDGGLNWQRLQEDADRRSQLAGSNSGGVELQRHFRPITVTARVYLSAGSCVPPVDSL